MLFDFGEIENEFARSADDPAAKPRPPLLDSLWLGASRYNENARIRLFCFCGVGAPANSYLRWASPEMHARFPAVEVVVLELPGHRAHNGMPHDDYVACSQAAIAEIQRIHFASPDWRPRPFALFGFSLGARVAYEVASSLVGPNNEQCKKLYVSGRAAPHIEAFSDSEAVSVENMSTQDVQNLVLATLAQSVTEAQVAKYTIFLRNLARKDPPLELYAFARSMFADIMMGGGPCKRNYSSQNVHLTCPVHYYHAENDEVWPLQLEDKYDHLPDSWADYTSGCFSWSTCHGIDHGSMGAVESPVLPLLCEDLIQIVAGCTIPP